MIHPSEQPELRTERLTLRAFRPDDAADVQRLAGDDAIASAMMSVPHPLDDRKAAAWVADHRSLWRQGKGVSFAIALRGDGRLVGAFWIHFRPEDAETPEHDVSGKPAKPGTPGPAASPGPQAGRMGYWIGKEFWSRGYCTEAGAAVVRFAFRQLGLDRIRGVHFTRNPASGRVMRKIGMTHQAHLPARANYRGKMEDLESYVIHRGDLTPEKPPCRPKP